jgi:zinc transport system substrate-binding protein
MTRLWSFLFVIAAGCGVGVQPALPSGQTVAVVASVVPIAYIVEEVGGERVRVDALVPPGASPHTFEPVPSDMVKLQGARYFIGVGGGFDGWSGKLLGGAPAELEALSLITVPNMNPLEADHDHHGHGDEPAKKTEKGHDDHGHGHEEKRAEKHDDHGHGKRDVSERHEGMDPHFWLDPIRVRDAVVPVLVEHLIEADPAGKEYYEKRGKDFYQRLTALDIRIRRELATAKGRKFVAFHNAWRYFSQQYNVEEVAVVQEFAGEEPSPREVAQLVRDARAAGIRSILVEPQLSPRIAQTIANEFGAGTVIVDPVGDPGDPARSSYEKLMLFNTRAFARALGGNRN